MKNQFIITILSLFICNWGAFAQNTIEDLKKAGDFLSQEEIYLEIEVVAFETATSKGEQLGTSKIARLGNKYCSQSFQEEVIVSDEGVLIIDHQQKMMLWNEMKRSFPKPDVPKMDSLLALNDSVIYAGKHKGIKQYKVYQSNHLIWRTDLFLEENGAVKMMRYYYQKNTDQMAFDAHHVDLIYTSRSKVTSKELSSPKKYLSKVKGKWVLKPNYTNYTMVNGSSAFQNQN